MANPLVQEDPEAAIEILAAYLNTYLKEEVREEVDFIIETARRQSGSLPHVVAVEVKRSDKWDRAWEKPLRSLLDNASLKVDRLIGVYCGSRSYQFDALTVWPLEEFVKALLAGEVF